jgi:hypothetical protein
MFRPLVESRVEKRNQIAGVLIKARDVVAFERTARETGTRQVIQVICTAVSLGNNVVQMKR